MHACLFSHQNTQFKCWLSIGLLHTMYLISDGCKHVILYVGSDYLSCIEWGNKWAWALTNSFQNLDSFTNLQEVFLISYFKVVVDFYSSIVTFLQFINKINHIKLYCAQLDMSRNRILPINDNWDWLKCKLKMQLP
jgi:hypothetical protein